MSMVPDRRKNPYCTVWRELKFKAYSSPEWNEVAKQLRRRCAKQDVPCEKTPKQCKDKLSNLRINYAPLDLAKEELKVRIRTPIQRMRMRSVIRKS